MGYSAGGAVAHRARRGVQWPRVPERLTNGGSNRPTAAWFARHIARFRRVGFRRVKSLCLEQLRLFAGMAELILGVSLTTAGFALATWLVYVLAYTPLKTRSPLNTAVGAD